MSKMVEIPQTKKGQYETAVRLDSAYEAYLHAKEEYEALREVADEMAKKQTTTFEYRGHKATVIYEDTTTTKKDTKGLYEEFGITKADEERYTTRTPSTRFGGVLVH